MAINLTTDIVISLQVSKHEIMPCFQQRREGGRVKDGGVRMDLRFLKECKHTRN